MSKQIDYNSSSIQVLKGLEAVRKRPGMYIGSTSLSGLNHLVYEIVDNSVDEALAGFCTEIKVSLNKDGSVTVEDNGRGIPVDIHPEEKISALRLVFTTLHAGGKFDSNTYKVSGGLHGVGSSVVNALSSKFICEVFRNGNIYKDEYSCGIPTTKLLKGELPFVVQKGKKKTGTKITFYPDETIFETTRFKASAIKQRLKEVSFLNPNLTIIYVNERDNKPTEVFFNEGGLIDFVKDLTSEYESSSNICQIKGAYEGVDVDIAFCFVEDSNFAAGELCLGFTNTIPNPDGGTHVAGFKSAFSKLINGYAREIGLLKEKDAALSGNDIRQNMVAIVSVKLSEPEFVGQTKTRLSNSEATRAVEGVVREQLTLYYDRNYEELRAVCEKAVACAKRRSNDKAKVPLKRFSFEGNGKLCTQEDKDPRLAELFIVEGDSAGGSGKKARDRKHQAVLPLRGKILNVEKKNEAAILANEEIRTLISALGTDYGDNFNIENLKYDKIIIMTDADVDGAHIATLLLTFFFRFMPQLVTEGHIYLAQPPLYRVGNDKKFKYLYSDKELEIYRKKSKDKSFGIQRYKGLGEMDAEQLYETTMCQSSRKLLQINVESVAEASSLTSILMGSEVGPRKEYIFENGDSAIIDN